MTNIALKNLGRFVLLVLLQVLVLNNIQIRAFLVPHLYVLFILLLPFETPRWLLLLSSFFLGLFVDLFSYTVGLHAAACTLIAFIRPLVVRVIASRQTYEPGITPGISGLGFRWFLNYTMLMVVVHHLFIYMMEEFRFSGIIDTLWKAILNAVITVVVISLTQLLISRTSSRSSS
jgi:rod shape-determining protein MreD